MLDQFKNILASIDTRDESHPALDWAEQVAAHSGASLKLVDVLPEFPMHVRLALRDCAHLRKLLIQEKQEHLEQLAAPLRRRGVVVSAKVLTGHTSVEIIREVLRDNHDLVVRVTKGPQSRRSGFFGTTSFRLLRKCPCPVWIVAPDKPPKFQRLLAAVDPLEQVAEHNSLNGEIVELVLSIAEREQGQYHIVHAWSIYGEELLKSRMQPEEFDELQLTTLRLVESSMQKLLLQHGIDVDHENVHLVHGDAPVVIPGFAVEKEIDLLVIGTIGRSGIAGLVMGNIAEQILNRVQCAVLALKPAGFLSPIKLGDEASVGV